MFGLDEAISGLAAGHGAIAVLFVAFLLGLRHAADPDHLVAVSTLVASSEQRAGRAAGLLGAAWGAGHGVTLLVFGLPVILARAYLPELVQSLAEALIGAIIVALGLRLLVRWRRGGFHAHVHEHDDNSHLHVHSHAMEAAHRHAHSVRSPRQAFSIGLVHGMAGSAGVAVLIIAAVPDRATAAAALVVTVAGTALSMSLLSAAIGRAFTQGVARRAFVRAVPALAGAACLFGAWYGAVGALAALG
jgi:ABC-type nickel/cobalt efflux system permease component RcnA